MVNTDKTHQIINVHVWISGRVQGVGYRFATIDKAYDLGIKGWVKNLPDGRVEAVFEGEPTTVEQMIQWCHQGSISAKVTEVKVEPGIVAGFSDFAVRRN